MFIFPSGNSGHKVVGFWSSQRDIGLGNGSAGLGQHLVNRDAPQRDRCTTSVRQQSERGGLICLYC